MATREIGKAGVVASIQRAILHEHPEAWVFKVVGHQLQMSGVPDLLVVIDGLLFGFEIKYRRAGESREHAVGRATELQRIQIKALRAAGAVADVIVSAEEALALIEARVGDES